MHTTYKTIISCVAIYPWKCLLEPTLIGTCSVPYALQRRCGHAFHFIFNTEDITLKTRFTNTISGIFTEYEDFHKYDNNAQFAFLRDFKITKLKSITVYNVLKLNLCHLIGIVSAAIVLSLMFPYIELINFIIFALINKLIIKPINCSYFTTILTGFGQQIGLFMIGAVAINLGLHLLISSICPLTLTLLSINLLLFFLLFKFYILPALHERHNRSTAIPAEGLAENAFSGSTKNLGFFGENRLSKPKKSTNEIPSSSGKNSSAGMPDRSITKLINFFMYLTEVVKRIF